jgi:hemolysin activation/secretion protein
MHAFFASTPSMLHNFIPRFVSSNRMRALVTLVGALMPLSIYAAETSPLSATVIDGADAYSPVQLFAVYRDQLGRPINNANAREILAQIEALYARDGYSRPEFQIDSELVGNGILRVAVFEAQITEVTLSGDVGPYAERLRQLGDALQASVPLKATAVRTFMQQVRELPGLQVSARTARDTSRRNAYTLSVDAEYRALESVVQITNRGTESIGPNFLLGQLIGNNLLGFDERLGLIVSAAWDYDEYRGGGLFFDAPLNSAGTRLTTTLFGSVSNPDDAVDLDDVYDRERAVVRVSHPLFDSAQTRLTLSGGVDFDDLEVSVRDRSIRDERLRVAELGMKLTTRTGAMQHLVALQARQGIDALGSRLEALDLARDRRREDFQLLRLQYTQLTRVREQWLVRLDVLGQQSSYILPDAERYKIGGERLGRGFEVTQIAGDQGIGAKAELRREFASASWGRPSVYAFYDFGAAWKQDRREQESASTSGLGLAFDYQRWSGYLEVARPLTHADVEGEKEAKVFAEISMRL